MSERSERMSDLIDLLSATIQRAFDNETLFLQRFWDGDEGNELLECYMASERTRIAVLMEDGTTVTTTIKTDEFLDWAESR